MYLLGWCESLDQAEVELELGVVDSELSRADVETGENETRECSADKKGTVGEEFDSLVTLLIWAHSDHSRIRSIRRFQRAEMREPSENDRFAAGVSSNEPFENLRFEAQRRERSLVTEREKTNREIAVAEEEVAVRGKPISTSSSDLLTVRLERWKTRSRGRQ